MDPSNTDGLTKVPDGKVKGKIKPKHKMIAALIARGFSVKDVAKEVNLSESQISHLLSDKDSSVNAEITRILNELFADNDLHLINLYNKALQKLDNMLLSSDEEKQFRAIDRIIKTYVTRLGKNAVTIQQYFGIESQEEKKRPETFDEMILRRRQERGLPPDEEDKEEEGTSQEINAEEPEKP